MQQGICRGIIRYSKNALDTCKTRSEVSCNLSDETPSRSRAFGRQDSI
jgi:hypothetical protein